MSSSISIESYKGTYQVDFLKIEDIANQLPTDRRIFYIVDKKIHNLYFQRIDLNPCLQVEASEKNKALEKMPEIISEVLKMGVKRGDVIIAVGGGIIQDITCFIASSLFRGLDWYFIPTTLLAQADSCIGSKSSINLGAHKNILGTFLPPQRILLSTDFLKTLDKKDMLSGIGEMIKVHMIDSPKSFESIEKSYEKIVSNDETMEQFIHASLLIKKKMIELDEFDKGPRNVMNYGHSFGHAIEAATQFAIPHGLAVTLGMDMANHIAFRLGRWTEANYQKHRPLLQKNTANFWNINVPIDAFIQAISKDKKNSAKNLNLILPDAAGQLDKVPVPNNEEFKSLCHNYFTEVR